MKYRTTVNLIYEFLVPVTAENVRKSFNDIMISLCDDSNLSSQGIDLDFSDSSASITCVIQSDAFTLTCNEPQVIDAFDKSMEKIVKAIKSMGSSVPLETADFRFKFTSCMIELI